MKIDRLVGILTVLLRQGSATAPELAARFEVSRRTISRDVEDLCRAGIPLVTTQGYGGGISIAEGYRFRPDLLTQEELETLLAGLGGMGTVTRGPHITTLLEKLPPGEGAIAIDLASHYRDTLTGKIALLRQCIREKRLVTFRYWYRKGACQREVEPYRLLYRWRDWYLWGWCRLRQDYRLFKLSRLWEPEAAPPLPRPGTPPRGAGPGPVPPGRRHPPEGAVRPRSRLPFGGGIRSRQLDRDGKGPAAGAGLLRLGEHGGMDPQLWQPGGGAGAPGPPGGTAPDGGPAAGEIRGNMTASRPVSPGILEKIIFTGGTLL